MGRFINGRHTLPISRVPSITPNRKVAFFEIELTPGKTIFIFADTHEGNPVEPEDIDAHGMLKTPAYQYKITVDKRKGTSCRSQSFRVGPKKLRTPNGKVDTFSLTSAEEKMTLSEKERMHKEIKAVFSRVRIPELGYKGHRQIVNALGKLQITTGDLPPTEGLRRL